MLDKMGYSSAGLPEGLLKDVLKTGHGWSRFASMEAFGFDPLSSLSRDTDQRRPN